jgi:hypothetical protein
MASGPTPTTSWPIGKDIWRSAYHPKMITRPSSVSILTPAPTCCALRPLIGAEEGGKQVFRQAQRACSARTWIAYRVGQQAALVVVEGIGSYGAGSPTACCSGIPGGHDDIGGPADSVRPTISTPLASPGRSCSSTSIDCPDHARTDDVSTTRAQSMRYCFGSHRRTPGVG